MVRRTDRSKLWGSVRWPVALLLTVAAVWLSVRQVQWDVVALTLSRAKLGLLAVALGTVLCTTAAKSLRWRLLLGQAGSEIGALKVLRALLIGQLGNILLPVRLGDLARAVIVGPSTPGGVPAALGTLLVEKVLDGMMGLVVLIGLALWTPLPPWLQKPFLALALTTAAVGGLLLAATWQQDRTSRLTLTLVRHLRDPVRSRLTGFLADLSLGLGVLRQSGTAWAAAALSALVWGLAALTNLVTLTALDIHAPLWSTLLVLVTGYVAAFLPAVPGQVGVFEFAAVLALTTAGVDPGQALAFALVLHLVVYAPPVVLGSMSMAFEGVHWASFKRADSVLRGHSGDSA